MCFFHANRTEGLSEKHDVLIAMDSIAIFFQFNGITLKNHNAVRSCESFCELLYLWLYVNPSFPTDIAFGAGESWLQLHEQSDLVSAAWHERDSRPYSHIRCEGIWNTDKR